MNRGRIFLSTFMSTFTNMLPVPSTIPYRTKNKKMRIRKNNLFLKIHIIILLFPTQKKEQLNNDQENEPRHKTST